MQFLLHTDNWLVIYPVQQNTTVVAMTWPLNWVLALFDCVCLVCLLYTTIIMLCNHCKSSPAMSQPSRNFLLSVYIILYACAGLSVLSIPVYWLKNSTLMSGVGWRTTTICSQSAHVRASAYPFRCWGWLWLVVQTVWAIDRWGLSPTGPVGKRATVSTGGRAFS